MKDPVGSQCLRRRQDVVANENLEIANCYFCNTPGLSIYVPLQFAGVSKLLGQAKYKKGGRSRERMSLL
jgi:hypothetical protein